MYVSCYSNLNLEIICRPTTFLKNKLYTYIIYKQVHAYLCREVFLEGNLGQICRINFQKTCLFLYEKRTGFCCLSKVCLFDFVMRRFWNRDLLGEYSKFSPGKYSTLLNFYLIDHLKNGILYTSLTFSMHACVKLVLQVFHMECLNAELLMSTLFSFHKMCKKILTFLSLPLIV